MRENLLNYPETILIHPPPAIKVYPDFISAAEEKDLLRYFETLEWKQLHLNGVIARLKRVQTRDEFIDLEPVIVRAAHLIRVKPSDFSDILITHYPEGAGIQWHRDAQSLGETIVGLTLLNGCTLKFRHEHGAQFEIFKTELADRAAYVITDEAPWDWQHTIASHQTPRYTMTFRTYV